MFLTTAICFLDPPFAREVAVAVACASLLGLEASALIVQRSRGVADRWRLGGPTPLAVAAVTAWGLTVWLAAQNAQANSPTFNAAFCFGKYQPQRVVPGFDAVVSAYMLAGITTGAIVAFCTLGALYTAATLLASRARRQPAAHVAQ